MYSDILGAADDGKLFLLILLGLSAAFDLVDHIILLKRPESTDGFDGLTLEWFKKYLSDRSFNVRCSGTKSDFVDSSMGVPQGSVLGPLLFWLYTGKLEKIILKYKLGFHQYADDTQIYGPCNNKGTEELQMRVSESKTIKNNTDVFYLSASNKIHQGMFDNELLEDTCIGLSFKSY